MSQFLKRFVEIDDTDKCEGDLHLIGLSTKLFRQAINLFDGEILVNGFIGESGGSEIAEAEALTEFQGDSTIRSRLAGSHVEFLSQGGQDFLPTSQSTTDGTANPSPDLTARLM